MHRIFPGALALSLLLTWGPVAAQDAPPVPLFDNLGSHHHPISTPVPLAQQYFDQGMRLYYAFNHAESIRAFREAARLDPSCAICFWGVALAYGPNINAPMDSASAVAAAEAVREARARDQHASPRERALIRSAEIRYGSDPAVSRAVLDSAYAQALGEIVASDPGDLEAATLYAEARMTLRPWDYWTRDGDPQPGTIELVELLERVIERNPNHPGACHFYIHAVEATFPELAVPCAERLAALMPGAGHLVHMPGHIYIRVGRYLDAIHANEHAIHADESYIQDQRPGFGIYTAGYYPHNYDFLAFAAAMAGRADQAIDAARMVASLIPDEMLGDPGMVFLQHYSTRPLQMLIRFERWDEILDAPEPREELVHARAMWNYAQGRARLAFGEQAAARGHLDRLRALVADPRLDGLALEFNASRTVLQIGTDLLAGLLASAEGMHDRAIATLTRAAEAEDGLLYGEPPEWSIPVRHVLGAVLLEANRPSMAEGVYREDLRRFPENGWALSGLARALHDQGRTEEAAAVEARAWKAGSGHHAGAHLGTGGWF